MSVVAKDAAGTSVLLMGNEAIARGAIEAGVSLCASYPGNPSSEIIDTLAKVGPELNIYVEWSTNEKVAMEAAAAASFAGLRGLTAMKQNGLNVALDFLMNLNLSGSKGGLVVVVCDDPAAISSTNEEDTRALAKVGDLPLLEPSDMQEAKDMTSWAFDLSEKLGLPVMVRSVTRVSHARGSVVLGSLPGPRPKPYFDLSRPFLNMPALVRHRQLKDKLYECQEVFEASDFNFYRGPEEPEVLIVTSGTGFLYAQEARLMLGLEDRVGLVKLGTTWPLPQKFLLKQLARAKRIVVVEEVDTFLESNVKALWAQEAGRLGLKSFFGRASGAFPDIGEMNSDLVAGALKEILGVAHEFRPAEYARQAQEAAALAPPRQVGFCAGCPHRATYWAVKRALALDGRDGFVVGDIGCYSLGFGPSGFNQMKTLHAMGSGPGIAGGLGQLRRYGLEQPVLTVVGDSTFFHAAIPAMINAQYNGSNFLMLVLDNSATAMTGFQPHPGTGRTATGDQAPVLDIEAICRALGARVETADPFDLEAASQRPGRPPDTHNETGVRPQPGQAPAAPIRGPGRS